MTNNPNNPNNTFHYFAHLPSELRIKIWKSLLPEKRIVPVRFDPETQRYVSDTTTTTSTSTTNRGHPHSLLHTNRESRGIFLARYSGLRLSARYPSAPIYVDHETDTLFFHDIECSPDGDLGWDLARAPDRQRIRHVAIDSCVWDLLRAFKADELSELRALTGLRSIALVLQPDRGDGEGAHPNTAAVLRDPDEWQDEIRHVNFYVALLSSALAQNTDIPWVTGPPEVTMWICRDLRSAPWRIGGGGDLI
ncbi:hypothetical protein PVAG01_06794 [Phlyctema vagabunda]|uniref:2EXR domain-containing protein n=1 Tax=Phlyctema vagabunda TaxID=108571 RepID=A0ABR4PH27_9HELO